jgi:hypothetical protein
MFTPLFMNLAPPVRFQSIISLVVILKSVFANQLNVFPPHIVGEELSVGYRGRQDGLIEVRHMSRDGTIHNNFISGSMYCICFAAPTGLISSN